MTWQTMETAPKDGTIILGMVDLNEGRESPAYAPVVIYWSPTHDCWQEYYSSIRIWEGLTEWVNIPEWTSPRYRHNVSRET